MKLKTVRIRNFRCHKSMEIDIGSMHALVGSNNAGKSAVLRALDFLFNPSPKRINEESFYFKDTSLRIEVEGLFTDLTEGETNDLQTYLRPDGSFHLIRTAEMVGEDEDGSGGDDDRESKVSIQQHYCKPQPKIEWLNPAKIDSAAISEWWARRAELVHKGVSFADTLGTSRPGVGVWKEKAAEFAATNLTADDVEDKWVPNPQGYAGVLKATLPHFELIPAVRDATDESKVTKTNPFGRLIYEIMRTLDDGLRSEIATALKETTRRLNREGKADRAPMVKKIESTIRGFLAEVMPADLELQFQAPTVEVLLTTPKIYVDDGFKGSVEGKGHGMQRAVIFAILRAYAKLITEKRDKEKRTLILGVEEPELYMHPTAQRTVRRVFRAIADGGDQVLFSTHSPLMVDVAYFDEIIRFEGAKPAAEGAALGECPKRHQLTMNALIDDLVARRPNLAGRVTPDSMRERYGHAYTASRNEGFFASRVILVEGQTEVYALPIYAAAMGKDLDTLGVTVVESGGKQQMDRLFRVFNELGIVCYPVFDYDKNSTDSRLRKDTKDLLALLGRPDVKDPETVLVTDRFACFLVDWETDLKPEIADYDTLVMDARRFLGLDAKSKSKPLIARYIAVKLTRQDPRVIPPTIKCIIESALAAKHPGTCLKKGDTITEVKAAPTVVTA